MILEISFLLVSSEDNNRHLGPTGTPPPLVPSNGSPSPSIILRRLGPQPPSLFALASAPRQLVRKIGLPFPMYVLPPPLCESLFFLRQVSSEPTKERNHGPLLYRQMTRLWTGTSPPFSYPFSFTVSVPTMTMSSTMVLLCPKILPLPRSASFYGSGALST